MEASLEVVLTATYLIIYTLCRLFDFIRKDYAKFKSSRRRQEKYLPENGQIDRLLAQYLPRDNKPLRNIWLQRIKDRIYWLETVAVIYFAYLAARFEQRSPLLICLIVLAAILLNSVWSLQRSSLRKKLRLSLLLPAQFITYYGLGLKRVLVDVYKFISSVVRVFTTQQINFPLRLGLSKKTH